MWRYVIRRVLYMMPTVFGIVMITFLLFNLAGGDQAMKKLGKQATAKRMEEYDVQRGYDKPLLLGIWGTTRAYRSDFSINAAPWVNVEGAVYTNGPGRLHLATGKAFRVPLAFDLADRASYRWTLKFRNPAPSPASETSRLEVRNGSNVVCSVPLPSSASWNKAELRFSTGEDTSDLACYVVTGPGALELRSLQLHKQARHVFDSQLIFYLNQIAHFDFGRSAETNQEVSTMILGGIQPSLMLTVPMFFIGLIVEVSLALVCAYFRNRFIDRFFVVLSVALMSIPYLVWIIGGQYILAYKMRLFPVWGFESVRYLVLPVTIGVVSGIGSGLRFYRTVVLDEVYKDYVRTAFAKGVGKFGVLFKHVLKNAMIPILTSTVMAIPFLYTGSLLLETFFGIPGLGNLSINGILNSDFDVVRAAVLVGAIIYVIANLITDLCYTLVDPRVKLR